MGIKYYSKCDTNSATCVLDIVTVTAPLSTSKVEDKVQIFISGAFHGDERYGPHVSIYLIEFLASNYLKDDYITNLLNTREFVILPMTNPHGFFANTRESIDNMKNLSVDMNRDFPYNN